MEFYLVRQQTELKMMAMQKKCSNYEKKSSVLLRSSGEKFVKVTFAVKCKYIASANTNPDLNIFC